MKVLLHICCGACASSVAERLMCEGHRVTSFFYNPNIHPVDEYERRLKAVQEVARQLGFDLVAGPYDRQRWFEMVKGQEYAPEGGARCKICFEMRLRKTYEYLSKNMFDAFTTTLTVSPLKDVTLVNALGREIGGDRFICADFKKKGGFERATKLALEWKLYRQNYCGCIYSLENALARKDRGSNDR
ncbi:MAG: epoxyqueuosine reductase QueH [Candidatus Omnitrophota bacterium]